MVLLSFIFFIGFTRRILRLRKKKPALVMEDYSIVELTANGNEIVKRRRTVLCKVLEGKFKCTAQIQNVDDDEPLSFTPTKAAIVPEIMYNKKLSKHLKVSVWKDDLTRHNVDAVVNAANEHLSHAAGLAGALSQVGGPKIQEWSDDIIREMGKVPTGDVICTKAGNLPCKMIIHAVGPCLSANTTEKEFNKAKELLQKTVENILKMADSEKLQSVAIPAISSGIFNFPLAKCAEIIVKTVKSAAEKHYAGDRNLEVRLVNNDDPTVREMLNACLSILGSSDKQPGQNLGNPLTRSSLPRLDLGNVTLYLKKGCIENESTDVIVNTTGYDLDLSQGMVSNALLKKASLKIQHELNKQYPGRIDDGYISKTSGYKLKCKSVYHTVCAQKTNDRNHAEKILQSVVTRCLKMAYNSNYSSISFPALGTGNLNLDNNVVSRIMTSMVVEFSKTFPDSKMKIFFVIFPKDTETLKAFEREMERLQNVPGNTDHKGPSMETPFIELHTLSPYAQMEAISWLNRTVCFCPEKLEIHNNNIMHLSLEDHQQLMAVQKIYHVEITEYFKEGYGGFIISGGSVGVGCAALEVEALLCQAQENFAQNEEKYMEKDHQIETSRKLYRKTFIPEWDVPKWGKKCSRYHLNILSVEHIENNVLKKVFDLNSKHIQGQPQRLYQRVSAQFVDLICRVGFQREYAPPKEQKYGAGIYFTDDIEKAKNFWPKTEDKYIYFIEAQVLTGKHTLGQREMIVPPPTASDPMVRYDSVTNNNGVYIIFNGQQAYPEFIITCQEQDNGTYC